MIQRRDVVGAGLAAGIAALVAPEVAAAQQLPADSVVAKAVQEVRDAIASTQTGPWRAIARIREQQNPWLRQRGSYPDFIEVGAAVWDALYDWHVRYQQPHTVVRTDAGRYVMSFMFTSLILRPDAEPDYVGPPYDAVTTRKP